MPPQASPSKSKAQPMSRTYQDGLRHLQAITGDDSDHFVADLDALAPGFGRQLVEFAFGEIYGRPGLDLRTREIAAVAALVAIRAPAAQLKVHIAGACRVGWTPDELAEVMVQTALYAGLPAALHGLAIARDLARSPAARHSDQS